MRPSPTTTRTRERRRSSRSRYGSHAAISVGVGLLSGGAHRIAAVMYASFSSRPSPACVDVGWLANEAWWSASNNQSPLRSPVNILPVRLPPWAAGARPTRRSRARGSPNPGSGFAQ